jgi:hypothetical protein
MRTARIDRFLARRAALTIAVALLGLLAFASSSHAVFGVQPGGFESSLLDESGAVVNPSQAGAHPGGQQIRFTFNTKPSEGGGPDPDGNVKTIVTDLPPGLLGDPQASPLCAQKDFPPLDFGGYSRCPTSAQVGVATLDIGLGSGAPFPPGVFKTGVYNLVPPKGVLARIGFVFLVPIIVDIKLRTSGDYGLTATVSNASTAVNIYGSTVTLWGVPADSSHDALRFRPGQFSPGEADGSPLPANLPLTPFFTNPTRCGVDLTTGLQVDSWADPGNFLSYTSTPMSFTGCDQVEFDPSIEAKPTTTLADAPTGLDFHLHLPQHDTLAQNEVQSLHVLATEGQLKLGFEGETTTDLAFNAGGSEVRSALEALPAIGAGNVGVSGGPGDATGSTPYAIVFKDALRRTDVEELTVEDGTAPLQITGGSGTFPGQASVATTIPGSPEGSVGAESATAHLRDAVVKLPAGMTVNPPSADVLAACSLSQVGMSSAGVADGNPVTCPDASILGKATVITPSLDHPLPAVVYLARQNENPFGSLLAIYLVIDDPESGIRIKLPGKIEPDPVTGQLTVSFRENPQTPVEDIRMSFFGGPHASLKTPAACGTHTVTSALTPWTAPEGETKTPSSSFALTNGPGGGACPPAGAGAPNQFSFVAGTADPTAKAYTPFSLKLSRADGTQQLSKIDTTLPKGLIGKLAGVPYCPDAALAAAANKSGKAEQAASSCPAASQVGTVDVGSGAGPTPIYVSGKAYLAGPYKGAPLSLAVITPAVAGPFDLGTVVVRNALYVEPETAQVHAVSDPLPTILQGIPLNLRSVAIKLDRPDFTLNPTNCDPLAITGSALSVFNQAAALSSPFQVDECGRLGFKPSLRFSLKGETKRSGNPAVTAVLKAPKGDANIAKTTVLLPSTSFIDNNHISNPCTRVQFNENACPAKSVLGIARAFTPLLDEPLEGPVYFRANGGERELPDLVADLNGQIHVTLVGFIDSVGKKGSEKRRVRTRFANVPDAPVSKFVLRLYGGKRGLIENSVNLCRSPGAATVQMDAQNGKTHDFDTPFAAKCGAKKSKSHGRR